MNRYLKLVHMEIHRFRYILAGLMAITAVVQIGVIISTLVSEVSTRKEALLNNQTIHSGSAFFPSGKLSFASTMFGIQFWFALPILLSVAVLGLYIFLIWYRDWFGRQTFVYRLLLLPTARRHIYLAKATAILIFILGMVAFQLLLLPIENTIFNLMVPGEMSEGSYFADVISANQALAFLLPQNFDQFVFSYGLGFSAVLALFTAILLERSYRRLGIPYAILYLIACAAAVMILPVSSQTNSNPSAYLYPAEFFTIEMVIFALVVATSLWLGFRLLTKKITV
jgi:hypothetical protein